MMRKHIPLALGAILLGAAFPSLAKAARPGAAPRSPVGELVTTTLHSAGLEQNLLGDKADETLQIHRVPERAEWIPRELLYELFDGSAGPGRARPRRANRLRRQAR